jgi:serine/threonine protein phosphatase PrpC
MQVGAAIGPDFPSGRGPWVVSGRDDTLVFVSRATMHASSVPASGHVALLQQALTRGWRGPGAVATRLTAFFQELHRLLVAQSSDENLANRGWRIELCAAAIEPGTVWVIHVADHRVWRVRGERVDRLTVDETLGEGAKRTGAPVAEGLADIVTRVLGFEAEQQQPIIVSRHDLSPGDALVLTSGWFHRESPESAAETLIRRAGAIADAETAARFLLAERMSSLELLPHAVDFQLASTGVLVVRP